MKMLFKQRMFSWFDSYDIYDEYGNTLFVVKGQLSWGHCLRIFDAAGCPVGCVKEKIFTWMPQFELYTGEDDYVGCLSRELTLFRPSYHIDCNGWRVEGSFWEWDYDILAPSRHTVAHIAKELWNWTDTYTIEVADPRDALCARSRIREFSGSRSSTPVYKDCTEKAAAHCGLLLCGKRRAVSP